MDLQRTPPPGGETSGSDRRVIVIGGGPAGLTAAYELTRLGIHAIVIEKGKKVGGTSRTETYKDYYFDMGGHRFFTKVPEVNRMWREVLGPDFLRRPRLSRIYYRKRFLYYPLRPLNALRQLGPMEAVLIMLSYLRWQLFPSRQEETFDSWVTNRFGRRLFDMFFKTYTEKVWGISTDQLSAEWAAQRIKNLSLGSAIANMFVKPQDKITSLIEEFDYPRRGPGMMWETVRAEIERRGGQVLLNANVAKICRSCSRITGVVVNRDGQEELIEGTDFVSSMAIKELVERVDAPPPAVLEAAQELHYRDFLTVCLIVDKPDLFPDNWIYIHEPDVQVGRIQNFKNWSPEMVPDSSKSSLGLEYFCNEGDKLWNTPDAELIELGKRELASMGLAQFEDIIDGCVFRVEKAYPVYDNNYREHLSHVRGFVESLDNFVTIGRNGLHRYSNQDHVMLTGMLAVRNLVCSESHDLWRVNTEDEYQEEIRETQTREIVRSALDRVFPKLDPLALGVAVGLAGALVLFLATLIQLLKVFPPGELGLWLLGQFFPLYTVSLYGFALGFVVGWGYASIRNLGVLLTMAAIDRDAVMRVIWRAFY
jgi:protoporphyrinogen oxidase